MTPLLWGNALNQRVFQKCIDKVGEGRFCNLSNFRVFCAILCFNQSLSALRSYLSNTENHRKHRIHGRENWCIFPGVTEEYWLLPILNSF